MFMKVEFSSDLESAAAAVITATIIATFCIILLISEFHQLF
jgi:hypothetical protein